MLVTQQHPLLTSIKSRKKIIRYLRQNPHHRTTHDALKPTRTCPTKSPPFQLATEKNLSSGEEVITFRGSLKLTSRSADSATVSGRSGEKLRGPVIPPFLRQNNNDV